MASLKSPGLILKRIAFSETSLILKVFTRESGLITLIAKGAKRPKSKFHGLMDFFTLNQFLYPEKSKSDILTLTDISLMRDFPRLKSDPARQSLAHVFLELYLKYLHGPGQSLPHYELLLEHLERLDESHGGAEGHALRLCDFLLGLCAISGFSPQFTHCVQCGREVEGFRIRLDAALGGPICGECSGLDNMGSAFPRRMLAWLDRVQTQGIRAGHLPRSEEAQAEEFLLNFLGTHAGGTRAMKSLEFYHAMVEEA